jgi:phosphate transport system permease protein
VNIAPGLVQRRKLVNVIALITATAMTLFGLFWLAWILWTTFSQGAAALSPRLFTEMTPPPGSDGGLLNAIFGSLLMVALGVAVGAPIGVLAGTYLAEYGRGSKLANTIRFVNDILLSAPSILIGLFVYELVVAQQGHYSALAGGLALAIILLPVVVRTSDEALRLVPNQMREAGLALGVPAWKVTTRIIYRAGATGIMTGILLAVARISGETAPLLFTALGNQYWSTDISQPMANIPVAIYNYANAPEDSAHVLAWAGAFVITAFVLLLNLAVRMLLRNRIVR